MLNLARKLTSQKIVNFKPKLVNIDNLVFKCHYRVTVVILLIGVAMLSSQEYVGEHIRCLYSDKSIASVIERFCFFSSTFTVAKHYNRSIYNREVAHPGVGPHEKDENDIIRHTSYQWVVYVLFIQALFFYLPHLLWREMEQGKLKVIVESLKELDMLNAEKKLQSFQRIELHLKNRLYINRSWATFLVFCEFLNLVNLILQIHFTNVFLGYQFMDLGPKVYRDKKGDEFNPLDVVFPKVTKCTFNKFGPSGTIQYYDVMCILALNIVNEKVYVVLWFWYLILFVLSVSVLIWRLLSFFMRKSIAFNMRVFGFTALVKINKFNLITVIRNVSYGEWLFLNYLAGNMKGTLFNDFLQELAGSYETNPFLIKNKDPDHGNFVEMF